MTRKATFHSESGRWHITEGQDTITIACVYSCGDYRKERAEAHVMAAAHEMLDALQKAEQQVDYGQYDAAQDIMRAAIAKATKRV